MKTVTAVNSFLARRPLTVGNLRSDGDNLFLFGNKIARWDGPRLSVTTAGWNTVTTRKYLKAVGAHIYQRNGELHLDGQEWSGHWTTIN